MQLNIHSHTLEQPPDCLITKRCQDLLRSPTPSMLLFGLESPRRSHAAAVVRLLNHVVAYGFLIGGYNWRCWGTTPLHCRT